MKEKLEEVNEEEEERERGRREGKRKKRGTLEVGKRRWSFHF